MSSSNTVALARAWADAVPLGKLINEKAGQLRSEAESTAGRGATRSRGRSLFSGFEWSFYVAEAQTSVKNDLVAGRLVAIGRLSGSHILKEIDNSFWVGAEILLDTASQGGTQYIDVRVLKIASRAAISAKSQAGPGRPSKAEVIRAAIAEWAKTDTRLERPRSERHRAYHSYIAENGYKPNRDAGFSLKTLEKYECEYRQKFN